MIDRNTARHPNNQTSASALEKADFAVPTRTTHDRNSDPNQGSQADLLPYNGLDRNGLFRTPVRFRRPSDNDAWDGRGVPRQSSQDRTATRSNGCSRDPETGRLVPNSEATPEYSISTNALVGLTAVFMLSLGMVIGFMLAVNR
jgi:hypothetical protein